jgi:serine/threonine kinase PknH
MNAKRRMYAGETEIVAVDATDVAPEATGIGLPVLQRLAYSQDNVEDYPVTGSWEETQLLAPQGRSWTDTRNIGAVIFLICVLIALVVGTLIAVLRHSTPQDTSGQAPSTSLVAAPAPLPSPPTMTSTTTATATVTVQPPPATTPQWTPDPYTPTPDPESATEQLRQYTDEDYPVGTDGHRRAHFDGQWVAQLSSKHGAEPWTYDKEDGVTYGPELTLQEHQRLRREYGAKLLWSGDWDTGNAIWGHPDYWITIAPVAFPSAADALNWCTNHGLSSDHCFAQNIATGHATYNTA